MPAEKEPVPSNTSNCQPLIKLKNPFCESYGFKLDKYVDVPARLQEKSNNALWSYEAFYKWHNTSFSTECLYKARFLTCHYFFPGCDRTTSVFRQKTFCKESCLSFITKCSLLVQALEDVTRWFKRISKCLNSRARSAGNVPECSFYARKLESLERKSILVGKLILNFGNQLV